VLRTFYYNHPSVSTGVGFLKQQRYEQFEKRIGNKIFVIHFDFPNDFPEPNPMLGEP
jgi:hypothetical protein